MAHDEGELRNRLLELAVVVGMNEDTGLEPRGKSQESKSLFQTDFQPQLFRKQGSPSYNFVDDCEHFGLHITKELVNSLPIVCLPDQFRVYEKDQGTKIYFTTLTNYGPKCFVAVLLMYHPFYASKIGDSFGWSLRTADRGNGSKSLKCYVPCAICFLSTFPYFDTMKKCLSCLQSDIQSLPDVHDYPKVLHRYITYLSLVICPPPTMHINFSLGKYPLTMLPTSEPGKPNFVTDLDLRLPILVFLRKPSLLLQIVASILLEKRLVFMSRNYAMITLVIEALLCYIRPFTWQSNHVPILFSDKIGLVESPNSYLMGCNSMHREEVEKIQNEQILVDLDVGDAYVCSSNEWEADSHSQSKLRSLDTFLDYVLPDMIVVKLRHRLLELQINDTVNEVNQTEQSCPVGLDEVCAREEEIKLSRNRNIQTIFTEMMVDLFGNAINFLDWEINQFRTDEFIEAVHPDSDRPFYHKVCDTDMFKAFVKGLHAEDTFCRMAQRVKSPNDLCASPTRRLPSSSSDIDNDRSFLFDACKQKPIIINLPQFETADASFNKEKFCRQCVDQTSEALEKLATANGHLSHASERWEATNPTRRAACLAVRGFYRVAMGEVVEGLKDLYNTAHEDDKVFPQKAIKLIVLCLTPEQHDLVKKQPYYTESDRLKGASTRRESIFFNQDLIYDLKKSLKKSKFARILEKSDITSDPDVIDCVFSALACAFPKIKPKILNSFYVALREGRSDGELATAKLLSSGKAVVDIWHPRQVLKLSPVVSSDQGPGRLILTTTKLLFTSEDYKVILYIIYLKQIREVKITKFRPRIRDHGHALLINSHGAKNFRVALQEDCGLWKKLINEIKTANVASLSKRLADRKGYSNVLEAAAKNVELANAVYQVYKEHKTPESDRTVWPMTNNSALQWVDKLCLLSNNTQTDLSNSTPPTKDEENKMLKMRINLSPKETVKSSVVDIKYIQADPEKGGTSRLWVATDAKTIRLVNTSVWKVESKPIRDFRDNCALKTMCAVRPEELWVGAEDHSIYVYRTETTRRSRTLRGHSAPVVSIFLCGRQVVSASSNGTVIIWNDDLTNSRATLKVVEEPEEILSAQTLNGNLICCCTASAIVLYTLDGELQQRLKLNDFPTNFGVDDVRCCTCTNDGEIWAGDTKGRLYIWQRRAFRAENLSITDPAAPTGDRHNRFKPRHVVAHDSNAKITCIMECLESVWIGNNEGLIAIVNRESLCREKLFKAHNGSVTSMCLVENRYVVSGSAAKDGVIAVWSAQRRNNLEVTLPAVLSTEWTKF